MLRISAVATALILFSGSGVSAQSFAELPGQVVRDALAAADCPQTDVTTFGVRPATAKHRDCLYVALAAVGCARGNVDLCFQSLWDEMPPRRDPGAPRPLVEPSYWTDERVARLFAGYLPGTLAPDTVRATPQVANAHLEANRPPPPPPDSAAALANIMIPFPNDPQPLAGSLVFAETYGLELIPQDAGGWRIGRIALGSAAWRRDELLTGMRVPEIAIETMVGPRDYSDFPKCTDDACLDATIPSLVVGDFIRIHGHPMDLGISPPPGAPWIQLHPHVPKRMLNERFRAQLALARSGVILEDEAGVRVAHVEAGSPAEALGLQVGDQIRSIDRGGVSGSSQAIRGFGAGGPVEVTFIRDGAQLGGTLERRSGDVVFSDGIATIAASLGPRTTPNPFAAREAAERERMQEARAARPFGDFHRDLAAVLQLIYDGQHSEARRYRRQAAARTDNPLTLLNDLFLTPAAAAYEMQAWRPLARDYGLARSAFLGACGDVIARDITLDWVRDGVRTGRTEARTLYLLRGLETDITQHIERTGSIDIVLGQDATLRGWFTFFATHGCGSLVIERLDREMVAFAGRG